LAVFKARGAEALSALRGPEEELRAPSRVRAAVVSPVSRGPRVAKPEPSEVHAAEALPERSDLAEARLARSEARGVVVRPESSDPEEELPVRSRGPEALALRVLEGPAAGPPGQCGDETATEWRASMDRTAIAGSRIFPLEP
jgi:hypothetical protein